VIFSLCKRLDRIIQVVALVVAVSTGINLIEYYLPQLLPVKFTTVPGRAAGFAGDPNGSAMYIILPLPLVAFFAPRLILPESQARSCRYYRAASLEPASWRALPVSETSAATRRERKTSRVYKLKLTNKLATEPAATPNTGCRAA
jgi:hypothetical protein